MIRFLKDLYLTGFTLVFRLSRSKKRVVKAGGAVSILTVIEWFPLLGMLSWAEMLTRKPFFSDLSKASVVVAYLSLFFINQFILFTCGHGIRFERTFDNMDVSRRRHLKVSFVILAFASVVFGIYSAIAYRRFIGAN